MQNLFGRGMMTLTVAEVCWALDKSQHSTAVWFQKWRDAGVSEARCRELLNPFRVYKDSGKPMGVRFLLKSNEWGSFIRERGVHHYIGQHATEAEAIRARFNFIVDKYGADAIVGRPPEES